MLSKSGAKAFFLGGTALCAVAFVLLTLDTLKQFPQRSNEDKMTEEVIAGWHIWERNNCMGCHTLMGEGAYYAPELTKVIERRGKPWIREFLKDPEKFFPGRRKMIKYDFFDPAVDPNASTNVDHVLAFFEWIQEVDTNGFPPEPDIITDQARQAAQIAANTGGVDPMAGAPDYFKTVCTGCHAVGGQGGNVGPALDAVATKYERDYLLRWISDPQTVKPGTTMPALGLDPETLEQIVTYLETLK